MGSSNKNLQQLTDSNMELIGSGKGLQDVCSSKGEDTNVLILYKEKKSKVKATNQGNKKQKPCLTKSQKRKLKKLEEEKEQAALLSESIRTLEKYKIKDETYSLLRSSGNIGQVETMREKRRWAIEFSKAGLEVPQDDQPSKKRVKVGGIDQSELDLSNNNSNEVCNEDDLRQTIILEGEEPHDTCLPLGTYQDPTHCSALWTDAGSDPVLPTKTVAYKNEGRHLIEEHKSPVLKPSDSGRRNKPNIQDMEGDGPNVNCQTSKILEDCAVHRHVSIPTVVHVSRPNAVESKRKDLPIIMMEQEIMEAINEHPTVIICGETGCGKTTQVPQFLYEAGFGSRKSNVRSGIIGVTQPRRVAVFATAKRVAYEMGLDLGKEVGFQVRHDKRIGDSCSIKFMTDGILLREAQHDFLWKRYFVIILDEGHERSLNTDILIGMLSRIILVRQVVNFPFPTPPKATALKEAERCLKALEALNSAGRLTSLGKAMSHYPMSPRHSRILLTVIQMMKNVRYTRANIVIGYAVATTAARSVSNPFIMQFEECHGNRDELDQDEKTCTPDSQKSVNQQEKLKQKKLKQTSQASRAKFCNPSSDALSIAYALQMFELAGNPD